MPVRTIYRQQAYSKRCAIFNILHSFSSSPRANSIEFFFHRTCRNFITRNIDIVYMHIQRLYNRPNSNGKNNNKNNIRISFAVNLFLAKKNQHQDFTFSKYLWNLWNGNCYLIWQKIYRTQLFWLGYLQFYGFESILIFFSTQNSNSRCVFCVQNFSISQSVSFMCVCVCMCV